MENLKDIIESLLFVSEDPLTVDVLRQVLAPVEPKSIRAVLDELAGEYQNRGGGFYLARVAGGYQLRSRPEYAEWIRKLIQPNAPRLSKAALETLAIIAYKQPVIRSDIENIRGVDSGGVLRMLLERKLVRVLGRKEIPGRPLIYATTKLFLQVFDLKDLKDLPSPKEIETMGNGAGLAEETAGDRADKPADITEAETESEPGDETGPEPDPPESDPAPRPVPTVTGGESVGLAGSGKTAVAPETGNPASSRFGTDASTDKPEAPPFENTDE
jgi:segregation and condensation protein B